MKLAIIGSRDFGQWELLQNTLDQFFYREGAYTVTEVVSGGARGADSLGARWAKEHNIKLTEFIPDWDRFGKRAGFLRNEDIVENADMVLAFWGIDPKTGDYSKGTGHSLSIAKRLKKPTLIIYY